MIESDKITVSHDRVAGRRSYSSAAAQRATSTHDFKGLAVLLVVAFFVIGISMQLLSEKPPPPSRQKNYAHRQKDHPLSEFVLQDALVGDNDPVFTIDDAKSPPLKVVRLPRDSDVETESPTSPPTAAATEKPVPSQKSGKRERHDLDWYKPFTGGFWELYPGARTILEDYLKKAETSKLTGGFVKYSPMAEMCNQLLGLVASFGFALTTDRFFGLTPGGPSWYGSVFNAQIGGGYNWMQLPDQLGGERFITNKDNSHDNSPKAFPTDTLLCSDLKKMFGNDRTVNMNVNQYFIPLLSQNENHAALWRAFGDDIFRPLARFLLQPSAAVAESVNKFRREHFDGKFVVGIHLRAGGAWPATESQWGVYWAAAKEAEKENTENLPVIWFLAADKNEPRDAAKSAFGDKIVMYESVFGTSDLNVLYQVAFADVLLLAESDALVTSSWSTYSYVAAGLAGIRPYIVTQHKNDQQIQRTRGAPSISWGGLEFWSNNRDIFHKQPTSQPCFHFYFDWRVQDASCFDGDKHIDNELFNGERYC